MSRRTRLAVSIACAVLAVVSCLAYANHVRDEAERANAQAMERYGGEVATLVVAQRTIEAGEVVATGDVQERDWLSSLAPTGALVSLDGVVGREVTVPVAEGSPLTELNFRDATQMAEVPSGHTAVAVPITERLGISRAIAVGSRVSMYRSVEGAAELIGSDALVLAAPTSSGGDLGRGSVTIAVLAEDVPAVLAASTSGDLRLVVPASDVTEESRDKVRRNKDVPPVEPSYDKNETEGA